MTLSEFKIYKCLELSFFDGWNISCDYDSDSAITDIEIRNDEEKVIYDQLFYYDGSLLDKSIWGSKKFKQGVGIYDRNYGGKEIFLGIDAYEIRKHLSKRRSGIASI